MRPTSYITALATFALTWSIAFSQEQHADYVVLGKSINHRQSIGGRIKATEYCIFRRDIRDPEWSRNEWLPSGAR